MDLVTSSMLLKYERFQACWAHDSWKILSVYVAVTEKFHYINAVVEPTSHTTVHAFVHALYACF